MFGLTFEDFMALDLPNNIDTGLKFPNPSKYMFFSDYFNGFLDSTVNSDGAKKYAEYAEKLHAIAKKSRKYAYIFDSEAKLCEVLAIKYDLGARTRAAYEKGDKEALRSLAENEYKEVAKRIRAFHAAFEKQWFADNKPTGFDVQDIRIGGLIQRTESVAVLWTTLPVSSNAFPSLKRRFFLSPERPKDRLLRTTAIQKPQQQTSWALSEAEYFVKERMPLHGCPFLIFT